MWKIYFWIYGFLTVIGAIALLAEASKLSLGDWIGGLNELVLMFGLFVFVFNRSEYYNLKYVFLINLIILFIFIIDYFIFSENLLASILPSLKSNLGLEFGNGEVAFATIFSLPAIYANFKLITKK